MAGRRRRGRMLCWLIVLVLLCALALRFVFVVRDVQVLGDTGDFSSEAVVRIASAGFGESIFRVDAAAIEERVNSMGTIYLEQVRLRYPDTVQLTVQRRSRDAMLLYMGKIRVLDADGCLVESLDQVPNEDLVYVSGMQVSAVETGRAIRADEEQLQAYCAVFKALHRQDAGLYVSELKLDDAQNLRIITRSGITVTLGNRENMENKIAWMKSTVADLERRGEGGGTLDVSSGSKADYRAAE